MDFDDSIDEMNIVLGDSENVTFTPEEKQRAMIKAWRDSYAVQPVWDATLSFTKGTYRQALPSTLTTVSSISLSPSNSLTSDFPEGIDSDLYSVSGGYIQWRNRANSVIPSTYTLYLFGNKKLNYLADTVTDPTLQEYLIALGSYNTLTLLGFKKANLFLKNDTTMGELIALKRELRADVSELRGKLTSAFQGA